MKRRMIFTLIFILTLLGISAQTWPVVTPLEEAASVAPQDETGSRPAALDLAAQAVTVDVYQNMEGGNDGDLLTPDIMNATSYGGWEGVDATWEINGNMWVSTDNVRQFPDTVFVNGTNRSVSSTHTWMFRDKYELNYATVLYGDLPRQNSYLPYHDRVTIAGYYTPGQTQLFWNQHDTITTGGNQTFSVLQTIGEQGGPYIRAHSCTQPGWVTTFSPTWIKVEAGKTYWVNLHHDGPAGEVKVAVFDPDNGWSQVGETVVAASVPGSTVRSRFKIGRCSAHGDNNSWTYETYSYFSHIMIDYTDGTFPLLPNFTDLELHGTPGNKTIDLGWAVNTTVPATTTWDIHYYTQTNRIYTVTDLSSVTNSIVLTNNVINYQTYTVTLYAMPGQWLSDTVQVTPSDTTIGTTYWVSPDGQATWANCGGTTPLNGTSACSLDTANQNAAAGDTVYLRGGTYTGQEIRPENSGDSDNNRIIFTNYDQETVTIRDSAYGIYIYRKSYITVNGVNFYSLRGFMRIYGGHYNTISYCNFDTRSPDSGNWAGAIIADDFNVTAPGGEDSTYNWVHHCTFYRWVYGVYDEHRGGLLDIGSNSSSAGEDESYFNLIENNTFAYGGHHTLGVYSKYNVIRNNYFHNETNPANWDYEGYRASITEGPYAGHSLYEGNRYGFAGVSGLGLRSAHNIVRFNILYHNGSGGIQVVSSEAVDHADYNHIYHNTFYHNGHLSTTPEYQGGMYFANWSNQSPVGNIVKNNVFYDNRNGSVSYQGSIDPQIIENNWEQNDVDPGFVDLSGADPNDPSLPDLHLQSNSPAIDQGTWLTTITSASGSGNSFTVADAEYFTDGWGIIEGDLIQLANGQRARITDIDYNTNVITVSTTLSWAQDMGLSIAFKGDAYDLGAYDFEPVLELQGTGGDEAINLSWTVDVTLPVTSTWTIQYETPGSAYLPITGIPSPTRAYTLTDLTNGVWYTITLNAMLGATPILTDTVRVMPADRFVYLPIVLR